MRNQEKNGTEMWRIHQVTDAAMRALQPPGHRWLPEEEGRVDMAIGAHLQAGREGDLESYRETAASACCASYRRCAEDPASSPKNPVAVRR